MATSVSSLELLRSYKSYQSIIASSDPQMAIPFLSAATVNCSSRSVSQRASCKLRSVLAKSGNVDKLEADDSASSSSSSSSSSLHKKISSIISKSREGDFANVSYVPVFSILPTGDSVEEEYDLFIDDYSTGASSTHEQVTGVTSEVQERDFAGTPYVPIFVNLPLGTINMECELINPEDLINQLRILKSINVDGVKVDCWWGIVEAHSPQQYNWSGYKKLFQIVRDLKLKLQVVMSFHECGGNIGDDVHIPLPQWVIEVGRENPDIFFTDREGRRNHECLTWGIDEEWVLRGRTAIEVYFDYMKDFRAEFDEFFEDGSISEIEVGLGPCGELRYPSFPAKHGWKYPGIGEFQCYDKYLRKNLEKAAERKRCSFWVTGPDSAGSYNSAPHETRFFCAEGGFYSSYGQFFLSWYSKFLVEHADRVLTMTNIALKGTPITAKLPGIHWWYKTRSHAAEMTAGFYSYDRINGYTPIALVLKEHETALNLRCIELQTLDQHDDFPHALADPEKLVQKVQNVAWDVGIPVISENGLPCYTKEGYDKILENAKPFNSSDGRHLSAFTYLRLSPELMEKHNLMEFEGFVKRMHGE